LDPATRQLLELRRDGLIARVRELDREKNLRIREVTSSPSFDPFTHTLDPRVAELIGEQNALIAKIQEIDRVLQR
jgi:hypothetical protein